MGMMPVLSVGTENRIGRYTALCETTADLGCSAITNAMQAPIKETDLGNYQKTPDTRSRLRLGSLLINVTEIVLNGIVSRTCSMP